MKYLSLVLLAGCATAELDAGAGAEESEQISAVSCDTTAQWCQEPAPVSATLLHGVWAASASDVFAVGDNGTILRRVNGTWTQMTSPTTSNLRAVWGMSSSDVWASGVAASTTGTLLHFNGTAWSAVGGATTDLDGAWASGSTDAWFVGSSLVMHWNGSSVSQAVSFSGPLASVSGTGPSDVWVVGENSKPEHWNGSTWTVQNPGLGTNYEAVVAVGPNDVWVSDLTIGKEVAHWNGSTWTPQRTGGVIFSSMSALGTSDIWAVGGSHTAHWNGTAWTTDTPFSGTTLWSITTRPGNAWLVGDSSLIGHRTF